MDKQPNCKKCGRRLKSPMSIARGMGPKCAGVRTTGKSIRVQSRQNSGTAYSEPAMYQAQSPLLFGDTPKKQLSKREMFLMRKETRRRLFETRMPFQCGVVLPKRKPLVYIPLDDGSWREIPSGRVISHERLQQYLVRYRFI